MAMMKKLTDLQQLSVDLYNGNIPQEYAEKGEKYAEDKLRKVLVDAVGGEWDYYAFKENKYKVFKIMAELLSVTVANLTKEAFGQFVEFKDFELGDKVEFKVENQKMFDVAVISNGTNNLRRQKMLSKKVPTEAFKLGVKIYAEADEFIAGRINWRAMVDRVAASFEHEIATRIVKGIEAAYSSIHTNLKITGTIDDAKLAELINKVESATGQTVAVYGTKAALAQIGGIEALQENMKDKRQFGYVKVFEGTQCVELPNTYNVDKNTWGINNKLLLIIPANEKIVRCGFEGQALVDEVADNTTRLDQQLEYLFERMCHLGVLKASTFGAYVG
ncbi:MAG: hypothetical protein ACRC18_07180 [Cetobacterium sp.]